MQFYAVYTTASVKEQWKDAPMISQHHLVWNTACCSRPSQISKVLIKEGRNQRGVTNMDGGRAESFFTNHGKHSVAWQWLRGTRKTFTNVRKLWTWRKERGGLFGVHKSGITAVMRWNWAKENLGWTSTSRKSLLTAKPIILPHGLSGEEVWAPLPRSFKTGLDRSTQGNIVGNEPALAGESPDDLPVLVLFLEFLWYITSHHYIASKWAAPWAEDIMRVDYLASSVLQGKHAEAQPGNHSSLTSSYSNYFVHLWPNSN